MEQGQTTDGLDHLFNISIKFSICRPILILTRGKVSWKTHGMTDLCFSLQSVSIYRALSSVHETVSKDHG